MKFYAFYSVNNHTFVGLVSTKEERDKVLRCRPKDFEVMSIDKDIHISELFYFWNSFYCEDFGQGVRYYITNEEAELLKLYITCKASTLSKQIRLMLYNLVDIKLKPEDRKLINKTMVLLTQKIESLLENSDSDLFYKASSVFDMRKLLKEFFDLKRVDDEMMEFIKQSLY